MSGMGCPQIVYTDVNGFICTMKVTVKACAAAYGQASFTTPLGLTQAAFPFVISVRVIW
jgi:hypothetical protein